MGATAIDINRGVKRNVEIVMHIDETLDSVQREALAVSLENSDGIETCIFCESRFHLMLVNYDRDRITSQDILGRVRDQQLHAKLIGPV
jgi:hypothetical protein